MTDGIAECANVVLARIWLVVPSELCAVCRQRPGGDRAKALHLVASAGMSRDREGNYRRLDGAFHRFAIGERKISRVAESGEPFLLADLHGDEEWADADWIRREGIQTVAAQPRLFRGEVLGVIALFDRGRLDDSARVAARVRRNIQEDAGTSSPVRRTVDVAGDSLDNVSTTMPSSSSAVLRPRRRWIYGSDHDQ